MKKIVKTLSATHSLSQDRMKDIIKDIFQEISNQVEKWEEISILGIWKFYKKKTKPRKGINPKTMEPLQIWEVIKLWFQSRKRYN